MVKIFLDDEREPIGDGWTIVRNYDSVISLLDTIANGKLKFISFDHDIQSEPMTGYDVAKYIVTKDMDSDGKYLPNDFDFYVHSQNTVGAENIKRYLTNYLNYKKSQHA